jgi:NADPH2:quinone reductase
MRQITQNTMQAVALDRFGGLETLTLCTLPVPEVGPDQVLVQVESAGVGPWDVFEREGMFAAMYGGEPTFPYVLGSEGAGTVVAVGEKVSRFQEGDQVYGLITMRNPKGGFYAEYAAVHAEHAWPLPSTLTTEQAGAMPIDAGTALRGLRDILGLKQGEALLIFGASGGIGHMAVQLAKRMGARVLAVASGDDGVALVQQLGADAVVEGHTGDVAAAARAFAPDGLDAALVTAGGAAAERALAVVRYGGRVAYPNGVQPAPQARPSVHVKSYNAIYDSELMETLHRLTDAGPFAVHVARTFALYQAAEAHRALGTHFVGRLALRPKGR